MANLGATFDASQVAPSEDRGALPPGEYVMGIVKSEKRDTKTGSGSYIEIEFEVMDGDRKGARAWSRLNLWNQNAQAVEIAQRDLSAICHAVGKLRVTDTSELHGIPMVVRMGKRKDDPNQTEPKAYKPANGSAPVTPRAAAPATRAAAGGAAKSGPWA